MEVLVVDAANVVGSRPDGWWRDRAGAASRLHARLVAAALDADVVLVVEGAARRGPGEGSEGRVTTVHAAGSGDDAIVDVVRTLSAEGDRPVVVTADRGLRERVAASGAGVQGPSWLLDRLP
ncbi:hypothetical protein [Nocardioides caldifontis]|uniref:hypothetical protein n=1 Tax=Nocardioides caldifontis TaxID=2588938 RepID=UPI0011DF34AF|nr:hypothetical protein [Nocardioides caldifontis]